MIHIIAALTNIEARRVRKPHRQHARPQCEFSRLRGQQDRYRTGTGTLVELIVAQSTLDTARLALINARLQARTAKAQIEALIGRELQ